MTPTVFSREVQCPEVRSGCGGAGRLLESNRLRVKNPPDGLLPTGPVWYGRGCWQICPADPKNKPRGLLPPAHDTFHQIKLNMVLKFARGVQHRGARKNQPTFNCSRDRQASPSQKLLELWLLQRSSIFLIRVLGWVSWARVDRILRRDLSPPKISFIDDCSQSCDKVDHRMKLTRVMHSATRSLY